MHVSEHQLLLDDGEPAPFTESPNIGGALDPRYLVMHYTAAPGAEASVNWLTNERARASAHLVVGRDGTVTQLVPFERVAWHAGVSRWEGIEGLNAHSIGIELDNAGKLERKGRKWCAWFGATFPPEEVMEAVHKHEEQMCGWHVYPPAQIEAALEAATAIVREYDLDDIVGHDDIAPGRKTDPGPAFPMANFRSRIFGRDADRAPRFETTTHLNIRGGPGTMHEKLDAAPLPPGTRLEVLQEDGRWRLVDVEGEVGGERDVQGWVHGGYLRRVEP